MGCFAAFSKRNCRTQRSQRKAKRRSGNFPKRHVVGTPSEVNTALDQHATPSVSKLGACPVFIFSSYTPSSFQESVLPLVSLKPGVTWELNLPRQQRFTCWEHTKASFFLTESSKVWSNLTGHEFDECWSLCLTIVSFGYFPLSEQQNRVQKRVLREKLTLDTVH